MELPIDALLHLQALDGRRLATERELKLVPREVEAVKVLIARDQQAIEALRKSVREVELHSKETEAVIRSAQEKVVKLRAQQSLVRKNEEYQALTREIAAAEAEVGAFEEKEIGILYQLDEERKRTGALEVVHRGNLADHERRLAGLAEKERTLRARLGDDQSAATRARGLVPEGGLAAYDRLARAGKFPPVVAVNGHACGGCHMKISAGVELEARKRHQFAHCDYCGRIVFFPA